MSKEKVCGIHRDHGKLSSAEALQSVFLVASPFDVFIRFKEKKDTHPNLDLSTWNPGWAENVVFTWQRNFTKRLYKHEANNNVSFTLFLVSCLMYFILISST
ncbi:unnamed protein product [Nippostrongylus brasiliensis]|uniref:Protein patched homolog 2 (inferred by orthology to a human protein) n=1 Tax=Nippostrongylus brasiliensis TaxID=27835 RepID=A0A0N4YZI7_NIPBR|nr:unnamed protein product [Nippostrongylus brasiliensis]